MPAAFAALLSGLMGTGEAAQANTPEGAAATPAEASADSLTDSVAELLTATMSDDTAEPAALAPEMLATTPAAPPQPLSVPDLLARMAPPPPAAVAAEPTRATPDAAPIEASTGRGAAQGPGGIAAPSLASPTPTASPADTAAPAAAGQSQGAIIMDAPGGQVAPADAPSATPTLVQVAAVEMPEAPPGAAPVVAASSAPSSAPSSAASSAASSAPAAANPGHIVAEPAPSPSNPAEAVPQAEAPRAVPGAAPLPAIIAQAEPAVIAPIAIPLESSPPAAPTDPGQPAPAEVVVKAPDTPPSAPTGGASAGTLAPAAPEAPAAPARPTTPVPWPARQVVPFAVSLALGSDDSISLTLDPMELGRVEVAISRGADAHVSLRAERPETLALLQRDRAELERALAGTGFGAEGRAPNLSFGLGFGGNGEDRRERRPAARDGQGTRPESPTSAMPTHQAAPTARGLIDLAF